MSAKGPAGTVLVVDDSKAVRALLAEVAAEAGALRIEQCASGFEAMRVLPRVEHLVLVITDVNMPDITGLELVRFIREQERFKGVPLFIVSTDGAAADRETAMRLGASRYFPKPFDVAALTTAIREVLALAPPTPSGARL